MEPTIATPSCCRSAWGIRRTSLGILVGALLLLVGCKEREPLTTEERTKQAYATTSALFAQARAHPADVTDQMRKDMMAAVTQEVYGPSVDAKISLVGDDDRTVLITSAKCATADSKMMFSSYAQDFVEEFGIKKLMCRNPSTDDVWAVGADELTAARRRHEQREKDRAAAQAKMDAEKARADQASATAIADQAKNQAEATRRAGTLGARADFSDLRVIGSVDKSSTRRVLDQHRQDIQACHELGLVTQPQLAGHLEMQFTLSASGKAVAAIAKDSTLGGTAVEQCIVDAFKTWDFPKPDGGGIAIATTTLTLRVSRQP